VNKKITPYVRKTEQTHKVCPICKGDVIKEPCGSDMIFVSCKSCNAVVDFYHTPNQKIDLQEPFLDDPYKDPVMKNQLIPPIKTINLKNFNKYNIENIIRLHMSLLHYIENKDIRNLRRYLKLCFKLWPDIKQSPIDINLIIDSLKILG
jgi:hypothetical protein